MNKIFNLLARLASLVYQRRFIINGTSYEYVLPDQLISEVLSSIDVMISNPGLARTIGQNEIIELTKLYRELERLSNKIPFSDETVSNDDLILRNQYWADVRNLARLFLEKKGFDLKGWEKINCK